MQWMPVAASLLTAFDNRSFIAHFCKKVLAPLCQFVVGNPQVYVERSNAFCTIKVHSEDRIMTKPIQNLIGQSGKLALLGTLAAATMLFAADKPAADKPAADPHSGHARLAQTAPAKLVQVVRDATRQFTDVNVATAMNYKPMFGCVSGPDHGAMGVHYVNGPYVGDGQVDATKPEALIYEMWEGEMLLVGVEFIVDAATWMKNHDAPPSLEGQAFQLVNSPNRYGLPAFFELHVWAWRDNPDGAFVDWNRQVTCEGH